MRYLSALFLMACLHLPLNAGELKGERKVAPNKLIKLESDVAPKFDKDGKQTTRYSWRVTATDSNGRLIEVDSFKVGAAFVSVAPAGATVKVDLTVVDFDAKVFDEASAVVTVEGKGPEPGPDPGPGPEPGPDTPLAKALKDAFSQETATDKATLARKLGAVYAEGAKAAQMGSAKTVGQLFKAMEAGAVAGGVVGKLPRLSAVIAGHCKALPTKSSVAIDDSNRDLIVRTLSEIAVALGGLQ